MKYYRYWPRIFEHRISHSMHVIRLGKSYSQYESHPWKFVATIDPNLVEAVSWRNRQYWKKKSEKKIRRNLQTRCLINMVTIINACKNLKLTTGIQKLLIQYGCYINRSNKIFNILFTLQISLNVITKPLTCKIHRCRQIVVTRWLCTPDQEAKENMHRSHNQGMISSGMLGLKSQRKI